MDPMKLEDVVKAQRDFAAGMKRRVEAVTKAVRERPERILRDQETRRAQLEAELQAALKAREAAIRRHDEEIARIRAAIAALDRDLAEGKGAVEPGEKEPAPPKGRTKEPRSPSA